MHALGVGIHHSESFMRSFVRTAIALTAAAATMLTAEGVSAQSGVGANITPYAGYLVTGAWYSGPIGTHLSTSNSPMVGVQGSAPIVRGVSLVGNVGYASGDLQVGLPIVGGVTIGSANTWLYDVGVELSGRVRGAIGVTPFVQAGVGGMTTEISNSLLNVHATNVAYTGAVGVDVGITRGFGMRIQAKDWIGRFNSDDVIGVHVQGNLTHNFALSLGMRLGY